MPPKPRKTVKESSAAKPSGASTSKATSRKARKKAASPPPSLPTPSPPSSPEPPKSSKKTPKKSQKEEVQVPAAKKQARDKNDVQAPAEKKAKNKLLTVDNFIPAASAEFILTCGNGDTGQLGHGEDVTVAKRPRVIKSFPDGTRFVQAVAGGMHTVVLTSGFEVFTCGCNDEGALGRICYDDEGEAVDKDEDFKFRKVVFPEGCSDLVMISAGDSHTASLTRDGSVFIWGTFRDKGGLFGLALENRKNSQVMQKTKEPFLLSSKKDRVVVKIASGSDHIVMLTEDGKIFTSGAGDAGQLGRLTPHSRDRAIGGRTVAKMMTPGELVVKRSIRFVNVWCATYCCFAQSVDGTIHVWGLNNYRQLGVQPDDPEKMDIHFPIPSQQFVSTKAWKGFAGDHHILAVENTGTCYGIGRGADCRLGLGEDNQADSETLVEISSDEVAGVAAATGTSFYWNNEGRGFAWGFNNEAELGLGVEEESVVEKPKEIEIRGIQGGNRIIQISANSQHTVLLASSVPEVDVGRVRNAA